MGEARKVAGVAIEQREEVKGEVILEAQNREKNSSFRYAEGHLSSQKKYGVGTTVSEIQRPGWTPRRQCSRRCRLVCCILRARFACVTNDGHQK